MYVLEKTGFSYEPGLEETVNMMEEFGMQESIERLKDPVLLAQIAVEDQNPEVRKTAEERLEELNN